MENLERYNKETYKEMIDIVYGAHFLLLDHKSIFDRFEHDLYESSWAENDYNKFECILKVYLKAVEYLKKFFNDVKWKTEEGKQEFLKYFNEVLYPDVYALEKLANIYTNEESFKDLYKSFHSYKSAALQGDLDSIKKLGGWSYLYGIGIEKNVEAAFDWLSLAINLGANDEWTKDRFQRAFDTIGNVDRNKSIEYINTTLSSPQSLSEKSLFGQVYIVSDLAVESFNKERKRREEVVKKRWDDFKKQLKDKSITEIIIPDGIEKIKQYLFSGCSHIRKITIPNSVTTIEEGAFQNCRGLTSITIPNSVTTIGGWAFRGCSGLTSITIPNSVTTIEMFAFNSCTGLTSVTIPNSVTTIEENVFNSCTGLTSVTIPNSVTTIGKYAFSDCIGLTSVTIPNSVTTIEEGPFLGCCGLTSIRIPAHLKGKTGETDKEDIYD